MTSPRVLFLTESFHPVLGGGEAHIRDLSGRLVRLGFAATVLTRQTEASWPAEEELDGVRVRRVRPTGPGRTGKYAMVPRVLATLWRERHRHDLIVVRGTRVLGLPGLLAARAARRPIVMQAEVNGELSGEVYTWGTPLERPSLRRVMGAAVAARNLLLRDADAFVAMSRRIRDEFLAAGIPSEKVAFMPHGVDLERFCPAAEQERASLRQRLGLPRDAVLVVYTGRLLRGKGLEGLLEAFASVVERDRATHLVLVGSGEGQSLSVEPELRRRAQAAALAGRVTFTGRVDDVAPQLRACDVFVFPSEFEALGLSLLEAAACGLPAVGSRTGGIVDVIEDGRSGILVEPGDTAGLARALAGLTGDVARRAALGTAAREIACRRFDVRDGVARYGSLFRELTRSCAAGPESTRVPALRGPARPARSREP